MKIASSDISMDMKHNRVKTETTHERINLWAGSSGSTSGNNNLAAGQLLGIMEDIVELSEQGMNRLLADATGIHNSVCSETESISIDQKDKQKILLLQKFIEALTGKKFKFYILEDLRHLKHNSKKMVNGISSNSGVRTRNTLGWGLEYHFEEAKYEKESLAFASSGVINTSDGRTINFNVELNMSREFASKTSLSIRAGDAVNMADPLVINLDDSIPGLSSTTFQFDLDLDGNEDEIHFAGPGSGFLALDLNQDGRINDGSELFGPASGNGFLELAQYDSDNNNWIDENDPIFSRLRIWTRDESGNDKLLAIGAQGIGAIYLGNIPTPFQFKDGTNQLQGQLARSGIFLAENGEAGTIHHIDLAL